MWLKNAKIYDSETRSVRAGDIEVRDDRIAGIGGRATARAEAINLEGRYLLRGQLCT